MASFQILIRHSSDQGSLNGRNSTTSVFVGPGLISLCWVIGYRIGAVPTAASVGLPPWLIKTLGRWTSDCYERYIQCPHSLLSVVSSKLVRDVYNQEYEEQKVIRGRRQQGFWGSSWGIHSVYLWDEVLPIQVTLFPRGSQSQLLLYSAPHTTGYYGNHGV